MIKVLSIIMGIVFYVAGAAWVVHTSLILRLNIIDWMNMDTDGGYIFTVIIYYIAKNILTVLFCFIGYTLTHFEK